MIINLLRINLSFLLVKFYHLKQKSKLFFIFVILFLPGVSQRPQRKMMIEIVSTAEQYKKIIQSNPELKLVPLKNRLKPFVSEIYYSTAKNFTGQVLYPNHSLFLSARAAQKLALVQDSLLKDGFNLLIYDAYRPYAVTKRMWEIVPDERYAANPVKGSGHNRGIAIDLSLIDLKTNAPIQMPTGYDNFSDSAHYSFMELPPKLIKNRAYLRGVMEHFGFVALATEWWHFSLPEASKYPLLDLDFPVLKSLAETK